MNSDCKAGNKLDSMVPSLQVASGSSSADHNNVPGAYTSGTGAEGDAWTGHWRPVPRVSPGVSECADTRRYDTVDIPEPYWPSCCRSSKYDCTGGR